MYMYVVWHICHKSHFMCQYYLWFSTNSALCEVEDVSLDKTKMCNRLKDKLGHKPQSFKTYSLWVFFLKTVMYQKLSYTISKNSENYNLLQDFKKETFSFFKQ